MEQTNTNVKVKKGLNKRQKDMIFVACLVTIPLIHYLIFYVYVNFNSILLAFQKSAGGGNYTWNGVENFKSLFATFAQEIRPGKIFILNCVKNSLVYYVIHSLVGTVCCLFFSYYIFKKRFASKFFKVILFLPSVISAIAMTLMFKMFANDILTPMLSGMGIKVPVEGLMSNTATQFGMVVFYGTWIGFGQSMLLYSGAMGNISDSVMEAAQVDGATETRQFFSIALPLIYPTITTFLVNGIATLFASDMHLYAFFGTGADKINWTFGYYLLNETRGAAVTEYAMPATIGLFLTAFTIPLTFLIRGLLKKLGPTTA